MYSSKELALSVVQWAEAKKAKNPVVLDVTTTSTFADYFVICHASNKIQVVAIAEHIADQAEEIYALPVYHKEGMSEGSWVLLDMNDVIVHIFDEETREFYNLERLWHDSPRVELVPETKQ
ncbi:MAG: ribosome silencing factor [Negativicutes bacterium]|nr:ribosome silencing factor [Negativicutes bacterium]